MPAHRLLVVEDDVNTLDVLDAVLTDAGYAVEKATDGQAALRCVETTPPDLVLLDLMLPGLNGFSVCHEIKTRPASRGVKVLILTAKAFAADRRQAREMGADGFLVKPVNTGELLRVIRTLLGAAWTS
jgi:DNA-binding response OmpR family regulator